VTGVSATPENVIGAVSAIIWLLTLVMSLKYVTLILLLTVHFERRPWVPFHEQIRITPISDNFSIVSINYGFKDSPDVPRALEYAREWHGLEIELFSTSYFLSRETVVPSTGGGMAKWREEIFASMSRNAGSIVAYFKIPTNQVIELGTRVLI